MLFAVQYNISGPHFSPRKVGKVIGQNTILRGGFFPFLIKMFSLSFSFSHSMSPPPLSSLCCSINPQHLQSTFISSVFHSFLGTLKVPSTPY